MMNFIEAYLGNEWRKKDRDLARTPKNSPSLVFPNGVHKILKFGETLMNHIQFIVNQSFNEIIEI